MNHGFDDNLNIMRTAIENELRTSISFNNNSFEISTSSDPAYMPKLNEMLAYHMGWTKMNTAPVASGKRIRPILVLLTQQAVGGRWDFGLPAAAAIELIHNFSLIHDDIQDQSDLRHGRSTIWKLWGAAQAINAGDLMFALAHQSLLRLNEHYSPEQVLQAYSLLVTACVELTHGQALDLSYEGRQLISLDEYWTMVAGKTANLLATSVSMGAFLGGASPELQGIFRQFGHCLGLAFQAQDDYLGIWGDTATTGKSNESDLVHRKKSLPIVFVLEKKGAFAHRWMQGEIQQSELPEILDLLEQEGAHEFSLNTSQRLLEESLTALNLAASAGAQVDALMEQTHRLVHRQT